MSEPEDVLLDGARHAVMLAGAIRRRRPANAAQVALVDVRHRLELFVRAGLGVELRIGVAEPPARPTFLARLGRNVPPHMATPRLVPSTDGDRLRLPATIEGMALRPAAMYRVMAAGLAARVARGAPSCVPPASDRLVHGLFQAYEAAAGDALVLRELPGMEGDIRAARESALATRPRAGLLTESEQAVELLLTDLLASPLSVDGTPSPADSLGRAIAAAAGIRRLRGAFRGLPPVVHWGELTRPPGGRTPDQRHQPDERPPPSIRIGHMKRRPDVRAPNDDEEDARAGMWMVQLDDPQEHVEDPMGLQRPADRDEDTDAGDLADSLSELPEARLVSTPGSPREVLASDDPPERSAVEPDAPASVALSYPEWDYRSGTYVLPGATVRLGAAPLGPASWARDVRRRKAALSRVIRRKFERLRPRRERLDKQPDGSEVDLEAWVTALADAAAGRPAEDRLYAAVRPARRDVAVGLLVDASASTDAWVAGNQRIVDVEKEALLLVCDALDVLGDSYAVWSFSGEGPANVSVRTLRDFAERDSGTVARRIAGLEPEHYTRMGAAIRHATACLAERPARHRLLLVLSDGRPNDVDLYEGRYGIEDARRAVAEARLLQIHPYCLTVDREAPSYVPRIFGTGYGVLRHAERLPVALADVLRALVSR